MAEKRKRLAEQPTPEDMRRLWGHCSRFVREQRISCAEAIYQCDRVIENAYDFIDGVAEITGYAEEDEEDDN